MLSDLRELLRYRELFANFIVRDLKARYKRPVLGFFWSLTNPLIQMVTLTVVFKMIMKMHIDNYAPFLAAALLPWTFVHLSLVDASAGMTLYSNLMRRVYFPRELIPLSQVAANLVHFLLAMAVLFIYLRLLPIHFNWHQMLYLPLIILLHAMLVTGLGLIISCASVYFGDVQYLVTVGMNLVYYGSCVFYPLYDYLPPGKSEVVSGLASSNFAWVAYLNPVVPLVTLYRQAILANAHVPDAGSGVQGELLLRVAVFAVVFLVVGYKLFNAKKWEFAERI